MTNPLGALSADQLHLDKVEAVGVGTLQEHTLFSKTGPGVVKSLWMAVSGSNNPVLDGRIRVYYDGATTPSLDVDFGTLFATHWGGGTYYGSLSTPHTHVEINQKTLVTSFLVTFPMPFGQSIRIAYYNPSSSQSAFIFSMTSYALTATDGANGQRLRAKNARVLDQLITRQPGDVSTLANIQGGPGSIVFHAYVGGVDAATITPNCSNNNSWMERNVSIAVDGEAAPSIVSSGTEDWFDSGWYFNGWADYRTSVHSYVGTDKPSNQPHTVGMVTDLWSKWGGVPFMSSAIVKIETEPACITGDRFAYAILYYQ